MLALTGRTRTLIAAARFGKNVSAFSHVRFVGQ